MVITIRSICKKFLGRVVAAALVMCFAVTVAGCDYLGFYTRRQHWSKVYESQPRMTLLQRLAPEDSLLLDGQVTLLQDRQQPLLLAAVSSQFKKNEVVVYRTLRMPVDSYTVFLPRGDYELYVFADLDQNGIFERDELVGRTPPGEPVSVVPERAKDGDIVEGPPITVDFDHPQKVDFRVRVKVRAVTNIYGSLADDFFDPKYGSLGMYNPSALMAHTQGFLFGLEEYDESKTAVLFVHGISGTPRDWKYFVEGLDRSRFQPFFFYYPTGLPLDKLGSALAQVIEAFNGNAKNGQNRVNTTNGGIVVAAHSMGGLVALSAIQKLAAEGLPSSLKLFVSISTPYGGDDTALTWIERMPVVLPAWRDVATGSEFLKKLVNQPFPASLPFYLLFSYNDPSTFKLGESSDGVVALRSQLEPHVQDMITKVVGFDESHHGILTSEPARRVFLRLIETISPPKRGGAGTRSREEQGVRGKQESRQSDAADRAGWAIEDGYPISRKQQEPG